MTIFLEGTQIFPRDKRCWPSKLTFVGFLNRVLFKRTLRGMHLIIEVILSRGGESPRWIEAADASVYCCRERRALVEGGSRTGPPFPVSSQWRKGGASKNLISCSLIIHQKVTEFVFPANFSWTSVKMYTDLSKDFFVGLNDLDL